MHMYVCMHIYMHMYVCMRASIMKDVSLDKHECTRLPLFFDTNQLVYR